MKIYLCELTDQSKFLSFTEKDLWIRDAIERVDEQWEQNSTKHIEGRATQVKMELRNVDDVIVMTGKVSTTVQLICSRCACFFHYPCQITISSLFCKDPAMAGVAHLPTDRHGNVIEGKPMGQSKGFARHAHAFTDEQDLDITYLANDFIDLGEIVSEQVRLQVPFQPLCQDECHGICTTCGSDLNRGRCACDKVQRKSPFSVLRDFKTS